MSFLIPPCSNSALASGDAAAAESAPVAATNTPVYVIPGTTSYMLLLVFRYFRAFTRATRVIRKLTRQWKPAGRLSPPSN